MDKKQASERWTRLVFGAPELWPQLPKGYAWCASPCDFLRVIDKYGVFYYVGIVDGEWPFCEIALHPRVDEARQLHSFQRADATIIDCRVGGAVDTQGNTRVIQKGEA